VRRGANGLVPHGNERRDSVAWFQARRLRITQLFGFIDGVIGNLEWTRRLPTAWDHSVRRCDLMFA
jgi:hypothetical protein